jgi:pilus assembly protein FimV
MLKTMKRGVALALLLGASVGADAAGLGKLTVNSSLGQVLNAEIDLVSVQPGELDSMTARVAAPEQFREARIEYSGSLRLLRFSVEKRPSGQPYLKVTSSAPINEPFVDALIEVTWPAGRIQREYPILLDPPGYAQGRPPATTAAPAPTPSASATPPATAPAAPSSGSAATASGSPSARGELVGSPGGDTYGPVQKGDTLNKIAAQVKPSDVSLEQMLVALYRENQGAFVNNNMNRLKTGQVLKVPSAEEIGKLDAKQARTEIRTHVADWKAYREGVASGVSSLPARAESTSSSTGRVGTAAVAPPAPPSAEPKDTLKLSKSDVGGKAGAGSAKGGGAANQARLDALQEEVASKDRALRESQSRVADLERQIQQMQRLIDLKSGAPAKPADTKVAAVPPPKEAPKVAEVKPLDTPKPAEAPKVAEAPKAEPPKAEPPKADAPKPAEPPKVADAKPTPPKTAAKKPPPPPPSMMDELMDNWPVLAGALVAVGLLGFGAAAFIRRRKERAEAGPTSSMTSAFPSDLKPNSTTGKPGGGLVDTGNSSFLTDFDKTGPGTIDTDEVDPVAEAEVYIAYGRDAQAEEILKEALGRDKNRHEIALKLLEIYHARKSATAFENVAKELKESAGEASPTWQKAAAMGAQIDPTNPLYGGAVGAVSAPVVAPAPVAKPDLDFDIANQAAAAPAPSFDLDLDAQKPSAGSDLDISSPSAGGLDFDIAGASPAPVDVPSEPVKEEKPAFDFDLSGLDFPSSTPAAEPAKSPAGHDTTSALDLTDLNLDAGGGGGEAVGTKLELAKAYLEIGDKDGAREILQEVAKEGSSAQKEEAKKLIASL